MPREEGSLTIENIRAPNRDGLRFVTVTCLNDSVHIVRTGWPGSMLTREAIDRFALVARCVCALTLIALSQNQLLARGGNFRSEDRYNPQHIDSLPPEIRNAIYRMCREPKALHPFASYSENMHRIVLHFEHFYCADRTAFVKHPASACTKSMFPAITITG